MKIVGYTYKAESYHPGCAVLELNGDRDPFVSAEIELDREAIRRGIDRFDEYTFDSGDFPKVIFSTQVEDDEQCGRCGESL